MKHQILLLIWFAVITTSLNSGCKKNKLSELDKLPPATQTGANTFGCLINGKAFRASGKGGLLSNESVWGGGPYSDTAIVIGASNSIQKFELVIAIKYTGNAGIHYTIPNTTYYGTFQDNSNGTIPGNSNLYQTNDIYKGIVNVKFANGSINPLRGSTIVAGTFEMEAVNANGQIIKITEGRFDIGRNL